MSPRRSTPRKVKGSSPKNRVKKILARWSDGLFYIIKILKVSEMTKRCLVEFEDMSTAYVHFKDLLEENQDETKMCHNCGGQEEFENNTFLQCTNCEREYHRHCHVPPITSDAMARDFICRICVFAACAKSGGAKDVGPIASRFLFMKQEFPYDLEHLSWNPSHTHNVSECYCYCGGPGSWYNKMLQCCRCLQWFHEACVQCLDSEVLMGDRFYVFACAHCNGGEEFLSRPPMEWYHIVYVALFHLTMTQGLKYMDLDTHIVPFLRHKAHGFGLARLLNGRHLDKKAIRQEVLKVVSSWKDTFCCGAEVKKKCTLFALRDRIPPPPPVISIPLTGEKITTFSLNNPQGKTTLFKPVKYTMPVPYLVKGANKFIPCSMKVREAKVARLKNEHNYCSFNLESAHSTSSNDSWPEGFDANNNSSPVKPSVTNGRGRFNGVDDDDESMVSMDEVDGGISRHESTQRACEASPSSQSSQATDGSQAIKEEPDKNYWSLDSAFPEPANFEGINNPFLTDYEQDDLLMQRSHFIAQLDHLSQVFGNNFPAQSSSQPFPDISLSPPSASPSPLKGFKGELAKLITRKSSRTSASSPSSPSCGASRANGNSLDIQGELLCHNSLPKSTPTLSPRRNLRHPASDSPQAVNGVTRTSSCSPKSRQRRHLNGLRVANKTEPRKPPPPSEWDKKRLATLSRCLKNLSPTCGFRFPVLEDEGLCGPPIPKGNSEGLEENCLPDSQSSKLHQLSASSGRKGKKRKHASTPSSPPQRDLLSDSGSDSVRRSHRHRQTVKRFEMVHDSAREVSAGDCRSMASGADGSVNYNVISLRVRPDNTVDYLVDWCDY